MRQRKYTLPRHTNLASQGSRIGAFIVDLAIAVAITVAFIFGVFQFVFKFKTVPLNQRIEEERISSHLFYKDENRKLDYYDVNSDNEEFKDALAYFYTVYIPEKEGNEEFTPRWFNESVLQIEEDGAVLFEYQIVDGEVNKDVVASIKEGAENYGLNQFLQKEWVTANYNLNQMPSFRELTDEYYFYYSLEFVISSLIAVSTTYILIPIWLKNGTTLGKKVFGLCLADIDGYRIRNQQLLMRAMPISVLLLTLLIPIWTYFIALFVYLVVIFLVSFTLAMASPKKCSLHDFTGRTVVVDARTSILFDNVADEEAYIAKEDNLVEVVDEEESEEPKISYER